MSTPFVTVLPPPGASIAHYDTKSPHTSQPDEVPVNFLEVMSIREEVFVKEQGVPLENELDADDARSFHWIAYASVGSASSSSNADPYGKRGSTAQRLAVGTIRLVPPMHPQLPEPGSENAGENKEEHHPDPLNSNPGKTTLNPDNEPYVKIGRIATLQEFRKLGLGQLLVNSVLEWAPLHSKEILPPPSAMDRETARADGHETAGGDRWKGLILIHANSSVQKFWTRFGFARDDSMGEWMEEGIPHVGMWKRVQVKDK